MNAANMQEEYMNKKRKNVSFWNVSVFAKDDADILLDVGEEMLALFLHAGVVCLGDGACKLVHDL